jgi:hypothetical protein
MQNHKIALLISLILLSMSINGEMMFSYADDTSSIDESQINRIHKFDVYATSPDGNIINVTSEGGYVSLYDDRYDVLPWGYVDFGDREGSIIFLANVTKTSFNIMFLHLKNGSNTVIAIQSLDYDSNSYIWLWNFRGNASVMSEMVEAPSIVLPSIEIEPEAKISNELFVKGNDMHMVDKIGYLANSSKTLAIYPLYNDLETSLGYSELWTLMKDEDNDYYFSMFYMNSSDPDEVILSHTLRLNDFSASPRQRINLNSSWSYGQKSYNMTLEFPFEKVTVQVDGFKFDVEDTRISIPVSSGIHEVYLEEKNGTGEDERYFLDSWSDGVSENPRSIKLKEDTILSVSYKGQYRLVIESAPTNSSFAEWYDHGTNITLKAMEEVYDDEDTRHTFVRWSGDVESNEKEITIHMDSPKILVKEWNTQYKVSFTTQNLENGTALELKINDETHDLTVPDTYEKWVDSESEMSFGLKGNEIQGSVVKYDVFEWQEESLGKITSPIIVNQPLKITALITQIKGTSNITCQVDLDNILSHNQAAVYGSIIPPRSNATVILDYGKANSTWIEFTRILTDENGEYLYFWVPNDYGFVNIQARWDGDSEYGGAISNRVTIYLSENAASYSNYFGGTDSKINQMTSQNLPGIISRPVKPTTDFVSKSMNKIYSTFNFLPIAGAILTLLVISVLLGAIYLAPILFIAFAIVAYLKGTKKWPRMLNVLLVLWLLAFAILTFIEIVFIGPLAPVIYISLIALSSMMIAGILALALDNVVFSRIRTIKT